MIKIVSTEPLDLQIGDTISFTNQNQTIGYNLAVAQLVTTNDEFIAILTTLSQFRIGIVHAVE